MILVIKVFFYGKGVYWSRKSSQNFNIKSILFAFLILGDLVDMRKMNGLNGFNITFEQTKRFLRLGTNFAQNYVLKNHSLRILER
ncbi:MAG: hypothetical protein EU547_00445 [Promethearchaeota archaeon]|nr:MAG: hypothetical protein EU547_00445 [Candidatus Lokiarchaeota archaeon]